MDKATAGPVWLKDPQIAELVMRALYKGQDRGLYELGAWVVMANHVHMMIQPRRPLCDVIREIKSQTGREANRILGRSGQAFWAREYYDRCLRDPEAEARASRYIERNPVKAGLCHLPEEFRWSSANAEFAPAMGQRYGEGGYSND